ncbi:Coiled-coil domain-containing protein 58 [Trichinella pseudospiralis]|uniref:Protein MIX23 n=1 Tax=Trichinella pseudospiralis TaxID=6337 RepID=A0A0V1EII7_TRIPS|nr:Coiled-coil domain-containing protein 58 [Trichinella pseudospiralis]KRZ23502.1 Coiled-coil domain-containing protein 58 [Trichinella pseudospiralis]
MLFHGEFLFKISHKTCSLYGFHHLYLCYRNGMDAPKFSENPPCRDYLEFTEALEKMRQIDNKIIYELNVTIPTNSFSQNVDLSERCKGLYQKLRNAYDIRQAAIVKCISETQTNILSYKSEMKEMKDLDAIKLKKKIRSEEAKLKSLQSELNVEEVFYERCRSVYKPESAHF